MSKETTEAKKIGILLRDLTSLESYISDLFTFSPLPICFVSSAGVVLEFNPAFERISGYQAHEITGEGIETISAEEAMKNLIQETLQKGEVAAREVILLTKNRKKIPASAFTKARKDEDGSVVGLFVGVFNLTQIKKTERELQEKVEELEKFRKIAVGRELKMVELKKTLREAQSRIRGMEK